MPVVVTVHGNQQCEAEATVFWENAFAEKVRGLLNVAHTPLHNTSRMLCLLEVKMSSIFEVQITAVQSSCFQK